MLVWFIGLGTLARLHSRVDVWLLRHLTRLRRHQPPLQHSRRGHSVLGNDAEHRIARREVIARQPGERPLADLHAERTPDLAADLFRSDRVAVSAAHPFEDKPCWRSR